MAERPPACEAWRSAVAGWVVAQLDPHEEAELLEHLGACAVCRGEATSLLDVAAVSLGADLGPIAADEVAPPADLGDRVLARVARERRARWAGRTATAMAAAAAAVTVAVATGVTRDDDPPRAEEVVFAREAPGVDAGAIVAPDGAGTVVLLTASGLDPEDAYTLWLTPPGGGYRDRTAVGTFRADGTGDVEVDLYSALPVDAVGRVWVTDTAGDITLDTEPD